MATTVVGLDRVVYLTELTGMRLEDPSHRAGESNPYRPSGPADYCIGSGFRFPALWLGIPRSCVSGLPVRQNLLHSKNGGPLSSGPPRNVND